MATRRKSTTTGTPTQEEKDVRQTIITKLGPEFTSAVCQIAATLSGRAGNRKAVVAEAYRLAWLIFEERIRVEKEYR